MTSDERQLLMTRLIKQSLDAEEKTPTGLKWVVDFWFFLRFEALVAMAYFKKRPVIDTDQSVDAAPYLGRLLICMFTAPNKQEDRLADFEELLNTVWIPQFGRRVARLVYTWNAATSAGAIVRIGIVAAIADRVRKALGW